MITKDGRDTPIEKLTPENYIVPAGEEKSYHVVIEVPAFDQRTGRRLSVPRVQKFGKKMFEAHVRTSLLKQGYQLTILHDPTEWIKEQQAKAAQAKAEKAQAAAAAKEAEKAKMKAEIIAELKAQGLIVTGDSTEDKKPGRAKKKETE